MEDKIKIEELRNKLNLEIRSILAIMDMIDLNKQEYSDYVENSLSEEEYLSQQLELITHFKNRLLDIFKA